MNQPDSMRSRLTTALTDIHFWVPLTILLCGLLLLRMFH